MHMLTDDQKWEAVLQNNASFDGKFYLGVKTTKIFCRPSCRAKRPKRENTLFFDTAQQAMDYGLRPCKLCRPDLLLYEPRRELAEGAKKLYDRFFAQKELLKKVCRGLGASQAQVARVFKEFYGQTPLEYLTALRIASAKEALEKGTSVLETALCCGFSSLSAFYRQFRLHCGMAPGEYQRQFPRKK